MRGVHRAYLRWRVVATVAFIFKQSIYVNHYSNKWQNYWLWNSDGLPHYKATVVMWQGKGMYLGVRDFMSVQNNSLKSWRNNLAVGSNRADPFIRYTTPCYRLHYCHLFSLSILESILPWLPSCDKLDMQKWLSAGTSRSSWSAFAALASASQLVWGSGALT